MSTCWLPSHLGYLDGAQENTTAAFSSEQCQRIFPDLYIWDPWPVCLPSGEMAVFSGAELWMGLAASASLEPNARHDLARIRLFSRKGLDWFDHGWLFKHSSSPGSREWAGCATYHPGSQKLEVWYTSAGVHGERATSFIQRMFCASGTLAVQSESAIEVLDWGAHQELIQPGPPYQSTAQQLTGAIGTIKAFRDPFRFVDPNDGALYLLFTASLADSKTDFDGAIGAAFGTSSENLRLLPPLLQADGVNNELERPHVVWHADRYYLFFSTQARTFHPDVSAPTGLYGFTADQMDGEWRPLNGSGLVLSNPEHEPSQAYSWFVMQDLSVVGFVDYPKLNGRALEDVNANGLGRAHFCGSITPLEQIALTGDCSRLLSCEI